MKILLTLDYELYNGLHSGSVQNCLIVPMGKLQRILEKRNFRITLFVDACYLFRLNQLRADFVELEEDWQRITKQLKELSDFGHDIQLHLHPNWLHAEYVNGQWHSCLKDYKLSDMSPADLDLMFREGISLLSSITQKPIVAFRAGAYSLQTLKCLRETFSKYGIRIDSSVLRRKRAITPDCEWFDYTDIPRAMSWRFEEDVTKEVPEGAFREVSITTARVSHFEMLWRKWSRDSRLSNSPWGDGRGSVGGGLLPLPLRYLNKIRKFFRKQFVAPSIDGFSASFLMDIYKREKKKGSEYLLIMGHPKAFTPFSLNQFEELLALLDDKDECAVVSSFL